MKQRNLTTAVITRFHYPKDASDFRWRYDFWKNNTLKSLQNQTNKDFDIYVWCEAHHKELIEGNGVKTFFAKYEKQETNHFIDHTDYENTTGLPMFDIQIGLDSDDIVSNNLVAYTKTLCKGKHNLLVSYQPIKQDIKTGKKYLMKNYRKRKRCSALFAMYQPNKQDYKFAYYRSHYRMNDDWKTIYIDKGFYTVMIHDYNDSTVIYANDIEAT